MSFLTFPGSPANILGTAKLRKMFLKSVFLRPFMTFTSSRAYKPAIDAVVVASAGTILPALSLTVSQSISSSL